MLCHFAQMLSCKSVSPAVVPLSYASCVCLPVPLFSCHLICSTRIQPFCCHQICSAASLSVKLQPVCLLSSMLHPVCLTLAPCMSSLFCHQHAPSVLPQTHLSVLPPACPVHFAAIWSGEPSASPIWQLIPTMVMPACLSHLSKEQPICHAASLATSLAHLSSHQPINLTLVSLGTRLALCPATTPPVLPYATLSVPLSARLCSMNLLTSCQPIHVSMPQLDCPATTYLPAASASVTLPDLRLETIKNWHQTDDIQKIISPGLNYY